MCRYNVYTIVYTHVTNKYSYTNPYYIEGFYRKKIDIQWSQWKNLPNPTYSNTQFPNIILSPTTL
jgi:hypothetical protein